MIRGSLIFLTFVSALYFPWPLTALLSLAVAPLEPLLPLAAGIFVDTLYYTDASGPIPFFSLWGAIATGVVFFVRSRLRTGSMG